MIEEHVKLKKKDQIQLDKEVAMKLQGEFDKEQRLAAERAHQELEANIALIESWDDVQAKNNADYQLAERLQVEEQHELNDEEKAKLTELVEECSKKSKEEVTEGSSKRAGTELEQENEEGVAIDVIPLVVKPPSIVDWKIQKEGKKIYYKIIRADGSSKIYFIFSHMLKDFNREDMETR
nr:hypothetical protein [Tanacetum cinerariifolium]